LNSGNDGGSIMMTGSVASVKGFPGFGVYSAGKAALRSFARTWLNGRITGYHGSSQLWNCSGLSFGRLFGAHLVHKTQQMGRFCTTERTLSDSKQMKRGVYEQGREN
jgi:short chain dehydrogenase